MINSNNKDDMLIWTNSKLTRLQDKLLKLSNVIVFFLESRKISKSVISVSKLPLSGNMWTMDKYGCNVLAEDDGTEDEPKKKRKKKKGKNK